MNDRALPGGLRSQALRVIGAGIRANGNGRLQRSGRNASDGDDHGQDAGTGRQLCRNAHLELSSFGVTGERHFLDRILDEELPRLELDLKRSSHRQGNSQTLDHILVSGALTPPGLWFSSSTHGIRSGLLS